MKCNKPIEPLNEWIYYIEKDTDRTEFNVQKGQCYYKGNYGRN